GVAENFDRLVETLHESAESLRRAAEDNAHAFKTPIAVIRQSIEPLMRHIPAEEARAHRAVTMIERSVDKLDGLVSFARRMDEATADVLEPPRKRIDLSALVERMTNAYQPLVAGRRVRLEARIAPSLVVRASEDLLETVLENIIENAMSFTPEGKSVRVRLIRVGETAAELTVEDDGPGVEPANLAKIFERYFSHRPGQPAAPGEEPHFGIGLWIVRRNVEAVGGLVTAENRAEGGLRMKIRLPVVR
ncbi:MAG TPA: HAMP domain-containing sensor histidine kinase, partial [Azospirillaceae bacterium]|nr:HAMP domain-containing sensor histidine kinase [Azospirillaceae bacterium]